MDLLIHTWQLQRMNICKHVYSLNGGRKTFQYLEAFAKPKSNNLPKLYSFESGFRFYSWCNLLITSQLKRLINRKPLRR
jgi:hypothetical protein